MNVAADLSCQSLFIGCMEFEDAHTEEHGSFELVVSASNVEEAAARCRDRLDELAEDTDLLGPVRVYAMGFVEVADCRKPVLVNHVLFGDVHVHDHFPKQGSAKNVMHWLDDEPEDDEGRIVEPFWDGVERYEAKWKLYWCTTPDHDEDWFVIARGEDEAEAFHVDEEGYDEDDATAELVMVLPKAVQAGRNVGWPSHELLAACGAEFLPAVHADGENELRQLMGSGGRVVRIAGRVFAEGDIVANTLRQVGEMPVS